MSDLGKLSYLAENVFEAMLVAVFISPLGWLLVLTAFASAIAISRKWDVVRGLSVMLTAAAVSWFGSLWLASMCQHCTYVDRLYQAEARWGLLLWVGSLALLLVALSKVFGWRIAQEIKEV